VGAEGARGGLGGAGASGGQGGGGAGGTIDIVGTNLSFSGDVVDASGGAGGAANVMTFSGSVSGTSYTEHGFKLSSTATLANGSASGYPHAVAPGASDTLTLQATDGGAFTLSSLALGNFGSATDSITFTGTTASGAPVTQTVKLPASGQFQAVVFSASFTNLTSLSWTPGVDGTLVTNIGISKSSATSTAGSGQFLYSTNSAGTLPTAVPATTETSVSGAPVGTNKYYTAAQTPYIAGLDGGAYPYGLVTGDMLKSVLSDPDVKNAIDNARQTASLSGALAAVIRVHAPQGFDDYTGYDVVLFVNLTGITLENPTLALGEASLAASAAKTLATGGVDIGPLAAPGAPTDITGLGANAVWATLVPVNASATDYVEAFLGAVTVQMVQGSNVGQNQTLGDLSTNDAAYLVLAPRAPVSVGAAIPGLQGVAVSPDGSVLYGVNPAQGILVAANAGDLSQRQTFQDGVSGVSGVKGASAVVASADGKFVYVAGTASKQVAIFKVDPTTKNLTFVQAVAESAGADVFTALAISPDGSHLFAAGAGGIVSFTRDASSGAITEVGAPVSPGGIGSFTGLAVSHDGTLLYAVSRTNNVLVVLSTGSAGAPGLQAVQTLQSSAAASGLVGASAVSESPDKQYVYVTGEDGATLAVFQRGTSPTTPLSASPWQVLEQGKAGARGLFDADGVAVSKDNKYVYVTSGLGGTLTVYERQANDKLQLDQLVRGSAGLDQPTGLAVDGQGDVFVSSASGLGLQTGGLASFGPSPNAGQPHTTTITFSGMDKLNLATGAGDDTISVVHPPAVNEFDINSGDGNDTITLADFAGTTKVTTGGGNSRITVRSAGPKTPPASLNVQTGDGANFVEVDSASAGDTITAVGGAGDDVFQATTAAFDPAAKVTLDGGGGTNTLLTDAIPNGSGFTYRNFQNVQNYTAPVVSAGGPYTVAEGQSLSLAGTVKPGTATILGEAWDLTGDGSFADATGLTPTLTWSDLVGLGLDHPGTYPISLRVFTSTGTTDASSQFTVNYVPPTVKLTSATDATLPPSTNATLGVSYQIGFSATQAGQETLTGWFVQWGDGTSSLLSGDATSASHTYLTVPSKPMQVTAYDSYTNPDPTSPSTPPHIGLAPTVSLSVNVKEGPGTVSVGGPFTVHAGDDLVLTASTYGSPTAFAWDLTGKGTFGDAPGTTQTTNGALTTSQATLRWADLQNILGANDGPQELDNVQLRVTYADGNSVTVPATLPIPHKPGPASVVILDTPPTARFSGTDTVVGGSSTVSFASLVEPSALEKAGVTYAYDFQNNGTFATGVSGPSAAVPADLLAHPGTRVIHGRVIDPAGGFSDYTTTINVADVAPQVTVGPDQSVAAGATVALGPVSFSHPGYSTAGQPENFGASIDWGDGSTGVGTIAITSAAGRPTTGTVAASHVFAPGKSYRVTVTVTDGQGTSGSGSFNVTVGSPKVTLAVPDQTINEGGFLTLDAVTFTDSVRPTAPAATVNWGDGSPTEAIPASAVQLPALPGDAGKLADSHAYGQPGKYTVAVTFADGYGTSAGGSFHVTVNNVAPTVLPGPDLVGGLGVGVNLKAAFSDPGFPVGTAAETYAATINWGDGTSGAGLVTVSPGGPGVATTGQVTGSHTYKTLGDHTVTIRVSEGSGLAGSSTLRVIDPAPTLAASNPSLSGNEGSPVSLSGVTFSYPGFAVNGVTPVFTATIDWGDGSKTAGQVTIVPGGPGRPTTGSVSGSRTYQTFGTYPVVVTLANSAGRATQVPLQAVINNLPPVVSALPGGTYTAGRSFVLRTTFNDPGWLDNATVTVDWGDGSTSLVNASTTYIDALGNPTPAVVEPSAAGPGRIAVQHIYRDVDPHTVTLTVTDRGGLSDQTSAVYTASAQSFATTTALSASPGPFVVGQDVTFTATVSNDSGVLLPTGHVEFFDGATDLGRGTALTSQGGSGSVATSTFTLALPLKSGAHAYRAVYVPDGRLSASTGSLPLTVAPGNVARLTFLNQPGNTPVNGWVSPFQVLVTDAYGNPLNGVTVRLALVPVGGRGPNNFAARSVVLATSVGGVATFSGVVIGAYGRYRLLAYVGPVQVLSDPFNAPLGRQA
jgi:6-phosphogluconolactonase (cycloisomerase 2 family)